MKKIVVTAAALVALMAPALAQTTSTTAPGTAEHRATGAGNGTMMKGDHVPRNGFGTADDNKQTATGGQPGGSAERGR